MANWNLMAKLFSTLGLTAFGVGFTGMTVKGRECRDPSIFCGGFGFPANNYNTLNYDITNPYAFLNANINPTNSLMRTGTPSSVRKTQSGLPPDNISELKTNVGKAQEFLQEHLTNLSDADLEKLGISSAKRDRLLEYIKNVKFDDNADISTLIRKIEDEDEINNPNLVKCVTDVNGYALYFSRSKIPYERKLGIATFYGHLGIYGYKREALIKMTELTQTPLEKTESLEQLRALENGMKIKTSVVDFVPVGIDTAKKIKKFRELVG